MSIIITTQNAILILVAALFLFVLMLLLMLYDYYKNVYMRTFDLDYRLELMEKKIRDLLEVLRNTDERSDK